MTWLRRLGWLVLGLVLLVGALAVGYAMRATPAIDGTLSMAGLRDAVRIDRDAHGIPTIKAANAHDLMFALGVVHAQDRLWQLETHRRIGAGRLAEAFGEGAVESDRFLRALGVRRAAQAQWAKLSPTSRDAVLAYSAGINAVLQNQLGARPPEMMILGLQPETWEPADSLAWAIMMAWDLGGNWGTELTRMRLATRLPLHRLHEVLPPYPGEQPLLMADYAAMLGEWKLAPTTTAANDAAADAALERLAAAAPPSGIEGTGSNNWVVAGTHTTTGKPLLANDPHLKLSTPALWYFVRIDAPGLKVAGATMPGLPVVVLGQSERIAWGFTNTGPDVQDLYLERLNPDNPAQALTPEGWEPLKTYQEVIKVKGKPDVTMTVRESRHGPIVSDAGNMDDLLGPKGKPAYAIAMRWTALDADVDTVGVGLAMHRAGDVAAFIEAAKGWVAPMQNMVVADRDGAIGWISPGRVPLRKAANDLKGQVPAPGWDARYDWNGFLAPDQLPQERNPVRGWIATANQRVVPADYPHYITNEWAPPYRQQRIVQMLQAKPKHSIDDLRAMQADVTSLAVASVLPWLQRAKADHPLAAAAHKAVEGFDGTMSPELAAPLILWSWQRHLTRLVFADELGPVYDRLIATRTLRDALDGVLARNDAWWCDDKTTPMAETCDQLNDRAFALALDELRDAQGADVSRWAWGRAHQARSEHRPFSRVKALAGWFELRTPVGGDTFTVNVSRVLYRPDAATGELYLNEHGPSLRALYDLGDPAQSRFMHSSGQSGLPWSRWYASFMKPWAGVDYVPVWPNGPPIATLHLQPVR